MWQESIFSLRYFEYQHLPTVKGYCGICDNLSRRILVEDEVSQVSCIRIDGQLTEDGYSLADVEYRRKDTLRPWMENIYPSITT